MTMQWVLGWWNLLFVLPFGLGLLYLGLYTVSGWTFGEADADGGFDHDVDAHLDVDGHVEVDHDLSHDADTDSDSDSESESSTSAFLTALNWVGIGRMPVSLVLMILMLCWGAIGFSAVQVTRGMPIGYTVLIAIAVAGIASVCVTHALAAILGPMLFTNTPVPQRHELLGSFGEAMYPIDSSFGMVCGRDNRGEHFQVACRVGDGQPPIAKGAAVQLAAYSAKDRMFYGVEAKRALTPRRPAGKV